MDTNTINAAITAAIKANGNNEITGPVLQSILLQIVSALNAGKQDALVSATNIKTVGGNSLLGAGDVPFHKSFAVNSLPSLTKATLADAASAFGISEVAVAALFEGVYDEIRITSPDPGSCFLIYSAKTDGDHAEAVYGYQFGAFRLYEDLSSSPVSYSTEFIDFSTLQR